MELCDHNDYDELREGMLMPKCNDLWDRITPEGARNQYPTTAGCYETVINQYLARSAGQNNGSRLNYTLPTGGGVGTRTHVCSIPLTTIFPSLGQADIPCMLTTHASPIEFQILTNPAN